MIPTNSLRATQFDPATRSKISLGQTPSIRAEALSHYFGSGELRKQVLFENHLTVYPGEIIIMTGPSGSGKTTLLTLLGALRSVQQGNLEVLGQALEGASPKAMEQFRRQVGFIFQAHNLFDSLNATQNVRMAIELCYPHRSAHEQTLAAEEILRAVGLENRLHHRPKQLSGGQKQRVAIARGLVHQPRLVLADEPTAALDEQSGRTVVELLQKLAREKQTTIVIVTHDNRILDVADRILTLVDGSIRSDALVKEAAIITQMLAKCKVFERVTPRTLTRVADEFNIENYAPGDQIIRQGDPGDRFYLIRQGKALVRKGNPEVPIAELAEGDFFGEMALLSGQPRNASVWAKEACLLYSLHQDRFNAALAESVSMEAEVREAYFDRQ
ncbi:MAG: ATP-binding cassette domain-containing protein [Pirellula sp.]|jgi:putative ABC transport system ATP-binding protein|nr:ATP-binding cassette domain-containing protein [Pirellula sp.]